jgi:hypothetical protein
MTAYQAFVTFGLVLMPIAIFVMFIGFMLSEGDDKVVTKYHPAIFISLIMAFVSAAILIFSGFLQKGL